MTDGKLDILTLQVFGLLHCSGQLSDKADVFYNMLQEGGYQKHPSISSGDKDIPIVFQKMCDLSTKDIFSIMESFETAKQPVYT